MLLIIVAMILFRIKESVGEGVTHLKPGDKALPVFTGECGECPHCKSEESNMCDLLRINTDRGVMINDNSLDSLLRDSPYTILSLWNRHRSWCYCQCCKTETRFIRFYLWTQSCWPCCILFSFALIQISGASRIIGVDLVSSRFELAKKFGVIEFVNPKDHDKPVQQVSLAQQ
ncbi:alcohol dehydrogenase [Trifolium repens]|nr:alcohol dehydrogenase [Trifolium repens]